jgi:hypothetical protein
MSRRNALKHGCRAWSPALGPGESTAEWAAFSRAVIDDLAPATPLQAMWAGRAALLMWRLQRAAAARAACAARVRREAEMRAPASPWWIYRAKTDPRFPDSLHAPRKSHRDAARELKLLRKLLALPRQPTPESNRDVNTADALGIIECAVKHAHADDAYLEFLKTNRFPGLGDLANLPEPQHCRWTFEVLRDALADVAALKNETFDQLIATFAPAMEQTVRELRARLRRAQREAQRYSQSLATAPESLDPAARFDRYETTLHNGVAHALSQLRLLQSHDASKTSPNTDFSSRTVAKVGFVQLQTPENPA